MKSTESRAFLAPKVQHVPRKTKIEMSGSLLIKAAVVATRETIERALQGCLRNSVSFLHLETSSSNVQMIVLECEVSSLDEQLPEATLLKKECALIVAAIHAMAPGSVLWISGFRLYDLRWWQEMLSGGGQTKQD